MKDFLFYFVTITTELNDEIYLLLYINYLSNFTLKSTANATFVGDEIYVFNI